MSAIKQTNGAPSPRLHEVSNQHTDKEVDESTARIQSQLRLLQADDVAQIGKKRQVQGTLLTAGFNHWIMTFANVKLYLHYLVAT
ncbi:hypothetical protein FRB94_000335, partial [Tulasnella sp. JGI-2019a]